MFIFVRMSDNVVVGYANRPVDIEDMRSKGNLVYEIDNSEFSDTMIGSRLDSFEIYED